MMQYCQSCTSPRTPEYLLYMYHMHLRSLPWRHLHPDTQLMEQLFNVRHSAVLHTHLHTNGTRDLNLRLLSLAPAPIITLTFWKKLLSLERQI